jgi:hypothetical protein
MDRNGPRVPRGPYAFPRFAFLFKLPVIAADGLVCWLLWRIWSCRVGSRWGAAAAALHAWNPVAIQISAHHGNTDSIYAALCLASIYIIQEFGAWFWGGLILGAAINVKLIPVLLIAPIAATCDSPRALVRFLAGLTCAAIPFVPPLLFETRAFVQHALTYNSYPCDWGISLFFLTTARMPKFSAVVGDMFNRYVDSGRYLLLGAIVLLTIWARRYRNDASVDRYRIGAMTFALFLILTPGFGLQYAICVLPLLSAVSFSATILYSLVAGLMVLFTYWLMWEGGLPMVTFGGGSPRGPAPAYGLLAWAVLINFVWKSLRRVRDYRTSETLVPPVPEPPCSS